MARPALAVLVPGPAGDGSWVDAALASYDGVVAGEDVVVVHGTPDRLPDADVVLAHGIQYAPLVRAAPDRTVVMSDVPASVEGLGHATLVDWAWYEAARVAGRVAAVVADGLPVGLVAGPAVPTQRKVADAFSAGVADAGTGCATVAVHLPSFDDVAGGRGAGTRLVEAMGCRVLLGTADGAGDAAAEQARAAGALTLGFLRPHPDDLGHVLSDVTGVLRGLVTDALATGRTGTAAGHDRPVHAGLASGHLDLVLSDHVGAAAVRARADALAAYAG
ncbi:MAG: hypothetical protein CMH83_23015 [Nocardioides sp.]|nr:hypothetical protein [Nocardioides sp.]